MDINTLGLNFAKEIATELIAISTALLALSVTFAKDSFKEPSKAKAAFLKIAWVLLLSSTLSGILSLMLMAGNLLPVDAPMCVGVPIVDTRVRIAAGFQIVTFFGGVACLGGVYLSGKLT